MNNETVTYCIKFSSKQGKRHHIDTRSLVDPEDAWDEVDRIVELFAGTLPEGEYEVYERTSIDRKIDRYIAFEWEEEDRDHCD